LKRRAALSLSVALAMTGGALSAAQPDDDIVVSAPRLVAPGTWLISGALRPMREPDGNSIVFQGPAGLIVVDTGRHLAHRQAIKAFAENRHAPIVAIINSHWHLDHVSGNPYLKDAYPQAKVYASRAIDRALSGFLAQSAKDTSKYLDSGRATPMMADDIRGDLATISNGAALRPDVPVDASLRVRLAGRSIDLNLAPNAATDGDVWVYDRATRLVAAGDLVTMPSPFLDTACPQGWKIALQKISETPFKILIPGHGTPMTHVQFEVYRTAFSALIDCSNSTRPKAACASDWSAATATLRATGSRELDLSQNMTEYYVGDVLRTHGGKSATCAAA
jgi:glyoxylase-like metal-dependent hydrolase (beta-lactamase superfamily II)